MNGDPDKTATKPLAHDLGGNVPSGEAATIDRTEHDLAYWERQIDAVLHLLDKKGLLTDTAQLRVNIEELGPDAYENYSYYERWAHSCVAHCLRRGVVTEREIAERAADIKRRSHS